MFPQVDSWFIRDGAFWLTIILDLYVKSVLIIGIALLAALTARRASAAVRFTFWKMTFAALLVLPVLSLALAQLPMWQALQLLSMNNAATLPTCCGAPPK